MANRTIYTRAYSESSAGQFVSGKGVKMKSYPLSKANLLDEFRLHASISNREPTALVSVSDRIVDTVKRAFDKQYENDESAADVWIAFIEVPPDENATRIYSAQKLAQCCGLKEPNRFDHEFIFEWAIPEHHVLHQVSLQTLIDRGIQQLWFSEPSTKDVRSRIRKELFQDDSWWDGVGLGFFARCFGARAPLNWIPYQLSYDCVGKRIVANDLEDGINTSLYEWWLADTEFFRDYDDFKEYRDMEEERIAWDLIDFEETARHEADEPLLGRDFEEMLTLLYDESPLLVKHEKMRAAIEAEAVKLGL